MSNISYENFGKLGNRIYNNAPLASGRYKWMRRYYKFITKDILLKLNLNNKDVLLDIGCGNAKIINELSKYANKTAVIDHPTIISSLVKKKNIKYYKGNILKDYNKINQKFSKILVYSLIHYLENKKALYKLINICLKKLSTNGLLMIGDVPNYNKKLRFKKLKNYSKINNNWEKNNLNKITNKERKLINSLSKDHKCININDNLISEIFKKFTNKKLEVYILEQNDKLPMNHTRIDLIIKKYSD